MIETVGIWLQNHWFELTAAILGLAAIFLQIRQNVWYWLVSLVMVSMYIVIYIRAKLYADMSLQVYYLAMCFYGWYVWLFGKKVINGNAERIQVSKASRKVLWNSGLLSVLFFVGIGLFLSHFTDSDVPWWDAFTTALSFIATWMLARKIIENWIIWIVVDLVSVALYIYKGLFPTAVLFLILTILAFVGYKEWLKNVKII